ncbi:D-alanyl-D-alanine carboxypeptidase family protein [Virgibacillus sp. W0181]|uniref:D-alanyl-D-alanine carboxypeptidase family protein n=1 Tax=Virgibacillus sp. W0181 TaxID=3391581 RepID=UPI003F453CEA
MKHNILKSVYASFLILLLTSFIVQPTIVQAAETLDLNAESAILVDANSGKILYEKNADEALPPASMTKMMTEYLVWEAIEEGTITWETTTEISDVLHKISGNNAFSGIGLRQDIDYTVKDLYNAMAINSDNATTMALAELIAGSEGEFVKMMNAKAEEMGLPDYKFVNSTGLDNESLGEHYPEGTKPDDTNLLSAESAALLGYHLVNDYPESLEISSIPEIEFDGRTIRNWNWMLPHDATFLKPHFYEGIDGLKTGFTEKAGYCFTGTAERNGKRLISVVMKTGSEEERFKETVKLMDYGFDNFESKELFPAGYQLKDHASLPVAKGKADQVEITLKDAYQTPIKKGEEENYSLNYNYNEDKLNAEGELQAPIKKGEKVGEATLAYAGEAGNGYIIDKPNNNKIDIVTNQAVDKKNWFMLMLGSIGSFFGGLFSSIIDMVKGWF